MSNLLVHDTLKTLLNPISNEVNAVIFTPENSSIVVNRKQISDAQQSDPLLRKCFNSAEGGKSGLFY